MQLRVVLRGGVRDPAHEERLVRGLHVVRSFRDLRVRTLERVVHVSSLFSGLSRSVQGF